jgi:uncharacterized protein
MISESNDGCYLRVVVSPNSSENKIVGKSTSELKIKISSPPIDGKANRELVKFISKILGLSKSKIILSKGLGSKHKSLFIKGISIEKLDDKLNMLLKDSIK